MTHAGEDYIHGGIKIFVGTSVFRDLPSGFQYPETAEYHSYSQHYQSGTEDYTVCRRIALCRHHTQMGLKCLGVPVPLRAGEMDSYLLVKRVEEILLKLCSQRGEQLIYVYAAVTVEWRLGYPFVACAHDIEKEAAEHTVLECLDEVDKLLGCACHHQGEARGLYLDGFLVGLEALADLFVMENHTDFGGMLSKIGLEGFGKCVNLCYVQYVAMSGGA